jgi:hypothetical protein
MLFCVGVKLGLILWKKHKSRVSENRALRRIYEPNTEIAGGWRKLHNEKFHSLKFSPITLRVMKSDRKGDYDKRIRDLI